LPPFTTHEFAVFPFRPSHGINGSIPSPTEAWSTLADAFSTNLTCSPANVSSNGQRANLQDVVVL
jgi:hypothetical protein